MSDEREPQAVYGLNVVRDQDRAPTGKANATPAQDSDSTGSNSLSDHVALTQQQHASFLDMSAMHPDHETDNFPQQFSKVSSTGEYDQETYNEDAWADEAESEDDGEVAGWENYANRHVSQGDTDDEDEDFSPPKSTDALKEARRRWVSEAVGGLILAGLVMIPGIACNYGWVECTTFLGQPVLTYSFFAALCVGCYVVAKVLIFLIFYAIRHIKFLAVRFSYYTNHLEKNTLWLVWSLVVFIIWLTYFRPKFDISDSELLNYYQNAIFFTNFAFGIGFFCKTIISRFLAISFMKAAYYTRIRNALFTEYVVANMMHHTTGTERDLLRRKSTANKAGDTAAKVTQKHNRVHHSVRSATNYFSHSGTEPAKSTAMRPFGGLTLGSQLIIERDLSQSSHSNFQLSTLVEYFKENATIKVLAASSRFKKVRTDEGVRVSLRQISSRIFNAFKRGHEVQANQNMEHEASTNGIVSVLDKDVFNAMFSKHTSTKKAFGLFDPNMDGRVTRDEFHAAFVVLFKERRALSRSLNEGELAVSKLEIIVTAFMLIILGLVALVFFQVDVTGILVTLSSFILGFSFAFQNMLRGIVDSVQFIFFSHPFDIGDRISIDDTVYLIAKINILSTELLRFDNTRIYYPNAKLISQPITNFRRSPDQIDHIMLHIDYTTSESRIKKFERRLNEALNRYSTHFHSTAEIEVLQLDHFDKVVLRIWIQHRGNFQNMKRKRGRHSFVVLQIRTILEDLHIAYHLPTQHVDLSEGGTAAMMDKRWANNHSDASLNASIKGDRRSMAQSSEYVANARRRLKRTESSDSLSLSRK